MTSIYFWFLLVDSADGQPYKGITADAVSLPSGAVVAKFRKLVHHKNSNILTGVDASDLLVFKNKAAFDRRNNAEDEGKEQPLKTSQVLDGLVGSAEETLIVVVPSPRSLIREPGHKKQQTDTVNDILCRSKECSAKAKNDTTTYSFLLVDSASGQLYKGTSADFVSLPPGAEVAKLRDAVHVKNSSILTGIAPSQLLVFKNKAAFHRRNNAGDEGMELPLDPTESIGVLGSKEDMLVVVVPPPIQAPNHQTIQTSSFPLCQIPFFNSIPYVSECDGWISFGQANIPSTSLNSLYIRKCYKTIASSILKVNGIHRAIITGTPGIGKSLFLIYLLWRLVKKGQRVLFIYRSFNIYYDGNGGVFLLDNTRLPPWYKQSFWNHTLWCLFDSKFKIDSDLGDLPVEFSTFVVASSPRGELVNDFKKPPGLQVFCMPTWKEAELEAIAPLFSDAKNEWRDRFIILGGIPRHVLEVRTKTPTAILEAACSDCSLADCIKNLGINSSMTEKSKAVHSLVHMTSNPPFTKSSMELASPTARNIIVQCKAVTARHKMQELLASCEWNPVAAALCRYIFEQDAIELLEKGGTFNCRKLVGNTQTQLNQTTLYIPPSKKRIVDEVSPNQTLNQLYVPKTKNNAAFDAWIPGIGLFQIAVGMKHDIKGGARDDLAKLGGGSRFYWVLPPSNYSSFTKQPPRNIDQYAILLPYPE
ncbi:hypothetical protein ACHAW6_005231 [Cyclotella cf. meneghiniana]